MAYSLQTQLYSTVGTQTTTLTRTPVTGAGAVLCVSYRNTAAAIAISSITNQASTAITNYIATYQPWNLGAAVGYGQILVWIPSFPAGTTSITVTLASAPTSNYTYFNYSEYTGLWTSGIDAQNGNSQSAPGSGTDAVTSNTATPSNVAANGGGMVFSFSGSYSTFESNTAGTGFGNYQAINPASGTQGAGAAEDKRITTNAAVAGTFTAATAGNAYGTGMIVIPELQLPPSSIAWVT